LYIPENAMGKIDICLMNFFLEIFFIVLVEIIFKV